MKQAIIAAAILAVTGCQPARAMVEDVDIHEVEDIVEAFGGNQFRAKLDYRNVVMTGKVTAIETFGNHGSRLIFETSDGGIACWNTHWPEEDLYSLTIGDTVIAGGVFYKVSSGDADNGWFLNIWYQDCVLR
jgi:hypothetical protein